MGALAVLVLLAQGPWPGATISGRVTEQASDSPVARVIVSADPGTPLPPSAGSRLTIDARLASDRLSGTGSAAYATARTDRTFTLTGLFGSRVLEFRNAPPGWYVKAVRYGERDVTDTPIEFKGGTNAPAIEVVLSNRGALVTGTVIGDGGATLRGSMVYLLRPAGPRGVDVVASARAGTTGAYSLGPVRGGDYVVVALPAAADLGSASPERLARVMEAGERLRLADVDERNAQLHVIAERR
jgi:hypothetical protein